MSPDSGRQTQVKIPAELVDGLLEASIVGSFTKAGYLVRKRIWQWHDPPNLEGKVIVVTGASSGIGAAAATGLARLGAALWLVGRNRSRLEDICEQARRAGADRVEMAVVDVTEVHEVEDFVKRVADSEERIDGLIHNAGVLCSEYTQTADGTELTVATNVVAPFRLSCLLSPLLRFSGRAVIVTVSSGGMYTQRFDVDTLEMSREGYSGTTAYARAKRAQVELAHEWSRRWSGDGVASYSMHPGWVDTPGLREGLPGLARLGPLLRNSQQGADTVVWLAADGPRSEGGEGGSTAALDGFWLDRRRRGEYYLPSTRLSPEEDLRRTEQLWRWCAARAGIGSLPDESVL